MLTKENLVRGKTCSRCTFQDVHSLSKDREPKKGINIKNLGRNPPLPDPPPPRDPLPPPNSLCLGPLFPSKYRKKAYIKNFEGGDLGGPKILYAEFLRVLSFALEKRSKFPCYGLFSLTQVQRRKATDLGVGGDIDPENHWMSSVDSEGLWGNQPKFD